MSQFIKVPTAYSKRTIFINASRVQAVEPFFDLDPQGTGALIEQPECYVHFDNPSTKIRIGLTGSEVVQRIEEARD